MQSDAQPLAKRPWWRRWFGNRSERAAARHLKQLGYRILGRNYTCQFGELDLIALEQRTIVFVEVRSTQERDLGDPAASVDHAKQRKLTRLATYWLQKKRLLGHPARFDVLIIGWPARASAPTIQHFRNAFEAVD